MLLVVCRRCCLPLAIADCCMSCIDCCVVVNCGRARRGLLSALSSYVLLRAVDVVSNVLFCNSLICVFVYFAMVDMLFVDYCRWLLLLCVGIRCCLFHIVCVLLLVVRCRGCCVLLVLLVCC